MGYQSNLIKTVVTAEFYSLLVQLRHGGKKVLSLQAALAEAIAVIAIKPLSLRQRN